MKGWDQNMAGGLKLGLGLVIKEMLSNLESAGCRTLYAANP